MRNTIKKVTTVVTVLMKSWCPADQPKYGPAMVHTTINSKAAKNDLAEPTTSADFDANLWKASAIRHSSNQIVWPAMRLGLTARSGSQVRRLLLALLPDGRSLGQLTCPSCHPVARVDVRALRKSPTPYLHVIEVLGGGNAKQLRAAPANARLGNDLAAFRGGFRIWSGTDVRTQAGQ